MSTLLVRGPEGSSSVILSLKGEFSSREVVKESTTPTVWLRGLRKPLSLWGAKLGGFGRFDSLFCGMQEEKIKGFLSV